MVAEKWTKNPVFALQNLRNQAEVSKKIQPVKLQKHRGKIWFG